MKRLFRPLWIFGAGWLTIVLAFGCGGQPTNQIFVRVPTKVRINLKDYDQIFISKFLVKADFEGVINDSTIDYGAELQTQIRNEVQSYVNREVIAIDPAIVDELNPRKRRSTTAAVSASEEMKEKVKGIKMPSLKFWADIEKVKSWVKAYIYPEIEAYERDTERVGYRPLTLRGEEEGPPRRAFIFGVLQIRAIDRTNEVVQESFTQRPGRRPRTFAAGFLKMDIRIGLHFYVFDIDENRLLFHEFREENEIIPGTNEMNLTIYYGMMDRIMPQILSAIVPIYINTQRFILSTSKGE